MFTNSGIPGVFKRGDWFAEMKNVTLRRVPIYGKPFTAIAGMIIANGVLHIEGLISNSKPKFTAQDRRDIHDICTDFGFTYYITSSYDDDGKRVERRVDIEELDLEAI